MNDQLSPDWKSYFDHILFVIFLRLLQLLDRLGFQHSFLNEILFFTVQLAFDLLYQGIR